MLIKKIQENVNLLVTALKTAANAIIITDKEGIIQWANPAFTKLTGFTYEEALGKKMNILKSNKHSLEFYKNLWDSILKGEIWQGEMINKRKDGKLYIEEMTIAPVFNENNEITNFISVKQDITARKVAEKRLKKSEHQYRKLFQEAEELILKILPSGKILYTNISWQKKVEYSKKECKKILLYDFISLTERDNFLKTIEKIKYTKRSYYIITEIISKTNKRIILDGTIYPVIKDGNLKSLWMIFRDISKKKELEELQKEFISIVSHELKTPLTSIYASASLIINEAKKENRIKQLAGIIEREIERLIRLTNSILDVERLESGNLKLDKKSLSLEEIIHQVSDLFYSYVKKREIRIITEGNLRDIYVIADKDALMQVLTNLLSNAIKNSASNTIVKISVDKSDNFVRVGVTNYGTEIKKEFYGRVFQKFSQINEKRGGTGLGLYISKALIERMDGKIYFESGGTDKGTTFYIEVPAGAGGIDEPSAVMKEEELEETSVSINKNILLVEDDIHIQKILKLLIESIAELKVSTCSSGKEAIEKLKSFQPDLILLDVLLPDMDGRLILKEIQSNPKLFKAPVVFVTAMNKNEDITQYKNLGALEVIEKPINLKTFPKIIRNCLLKIGESEKAL